MGKKTNWEQTSINERIKHLSEVYSNGVMKSFAQKTMVSTSTLSDIVGKKQNSPSFDTLQNLTKNASRRKYGLADQWGGRNEKGRG